MTNIDRIFFPGNISRLAECIKEIENHRDAFHRGVGLPNEYGHVHPASEWEKTEESIQHHIDMWVGYTQQAVMNWRMISEASGYDEACKDDAK